MGTSVVTVGRWGMVSHPTIPEAGVASRGIVWRPWTPHVSVGLGGIHWLRFHIHHIPKLSPYAGCPSQS